MQIHIPKLSSGINYPSFTNSSIFYPVLQLSESPIQAFHDTVFIAQLIHAIEPKKIADLGCYMGVLSTFVEDLLFDAKSTQAGISDWSLVDTFQFLLDLKCCIEDPLFNGNELNKILVSQWVNISEEKKKYLTVPPTNKYELLEFLSSFCTQNNAKFPKISLIEDSILNLKETYDFIVYDLFGSQYSFDIAEYVINKLLNDDGIIIFDDMKPRHPKQMALFVKIIGTMPLVPIAFNSAKVAMIKSSMDTKHQILTSRLISRLNINPSSKHYYWNTFENPVFGKILSLKDHL